MSTVRNIERRMFARRQADREVPGAGALSAALALQPSPRDIEWNGVWTGYMIWAGCEAILLALVLGFTMGNRNPIEASSWGAAGKGAMVWAIIVSWISLFIGSWVAGRTPAASKQHGIAKSLTLWGFVELTWLLVVGGVAMTSTAAAGAVGAHSLAWNFFWLSLIGLGCAIGGGAVGGGRVKIAVKSPKPSAAA